MTIPKPPAGEIVTKEVLPRATGPAWRWRARSRDRNPTNDLGADDRATTSSGIPYYRELEEKDDDIGGALETMKLSMLGRERTVLPADDSSQALDIAEVRRRASWRGAASKRSSTTMLDAYFQGMSIAELIFDVSGGQAGLIDIRDRAQEMFSFQSANDSAGWPAALFASAVFGGWWRAGTGREVFDLQLAAAREQSPRAAGGRQTFWLSGSSARC
jgi:hypothetical protein